MPNWSTNHTVFIGNTKTLGAIQSAVFNREFDFDKLRPRPEVYDLYNAPTRMISDEEFAEKYDVTAPTSIAEFIEIYKQCNADIPDGHYEQRFDNVPETILTLIRETYGHDDWYDWCVANWGTKWTGSCAHAQRHLPNLLTVDYETAWSAPMQLFNYLENKYPDLQIINGFELEGFSDETEVTHGRDIAFSAYYSTSVGTTVEPYDFSSAGNNVRGIDVYIDTECSINTKNIAIMRDSGWLIDADGEGVKISKFN